MHDDFWSNKSVFITGATGFLGSWLTRSLVDSGARVTALVRDTYSDSLLAYMKYDKKIAVVQGQLEDYESVVAALGKSSADTIFHLGAQPIITSAKESPRATFETNIRGTWNVLDAARVVGNIRRVVVASSVNAYGSQKVPYQESYELKGSYPYDVSKSAADMIARSYYVTYGLPVAVTRCTSLYGGGDFNFDRVVPGTIRRILHGERPTIKNNGKHLRDFVYIEDAINAYLALAKKLDDSNVRGEAFNIGTGKPLSVLEIVQMILALMKSDLQPLFLKGPVQEIPDQCVTTFKAKEILGWKTSHSTEDGLKKTIEWYNLYCNK